MKLNKWWIMSLCAVMGFGAYGCGGDSDDDSTNPGTEIEACEGSACETLKAEAEAKMASCDFAEAYEALNSVFGAQVKANNVDAQTALDRSVLGLIHLAYMKDVQAIMPKLGFIANNGLVDFKPLWKGDKGLFWQVFKGTDVYEVSDRMPIKVIQDEDIAYRDTIDKDVTYDDVIKVLYNIKPEIETIAFSFEAAAKATGSKAVSPSEKIGCSLNAFKADAADLYFAASILYAVDALIDLVSKYDGNIKIYDYVKAYDDYMSGEYDSLRVDQCDVDISADGTVTNDECARDSLDYKKLDCLCLDPDEDEYGITLECPQKSGVAKRYRCFEPDEDDSVYVFRTKVLDMLNPHLFKKSTQNLSGKGASGSDALKKAAKLYQLALESGANGAFFDFTAIPTGVASDMKALASTIASGDFNLGKFVKPSLSIDLNKVFKDIRYRKDDEPLKMDISRYSCDVDGGLFDDPFEGVIGDEVFLNETFINYITGKNIVSHETPVRYMWNEVYYEFSYDEEYDVTLSNDWEDFEEELWLNPHDYFGVVCEDGEWCEERCPEEAAFYIIDESKPEGYFCSACSENCAANGEYCVELELQYGHACAKTETCPKGMMFDVNWEEDYNSGATCVEPDGVMAVNWCRENDPNKGYNLFYDSDSEQFYCSYCSEKCSGETPYCVANEITMIGVCLTEDVQCPKGEQPDYYDGECHPVNGIWNYDWCWDHGYRGADPNYIYYDVNKDEYYCSACNELCTGSTPNCINDDDNPWTYSCSSKTQCASGYVLDNHGVCLDPYWMNEMYEDD